MANEGGSLDAAAHALEARCGALEQQVRRLESQLVGGRDAEALLASILDTVPDFVIKMSPEGTIQFVNRVVPGLDPARVVGSSIYDFTLPEWHDKQREAVEQAVRSGQVVRFEVEGLGPHGRTHRYFSRVVPLTRGAEVDSLVLIATDVTELLSARAELHARDEQLALTAEATGIGLWSWASAGDVIQWDEATCEIFGRKAAPSSFEEYLQCIHPDDRDLVADHVARALRTAHFDDFEFRIVRPDGQVRWVMGKGRVELDASGGASRLAGGILDRTEHRQLEEELQQVRKLDAVGQLAAGIAHNFNNMLTVILSSAELAAKRSSPDVAALLEEGRQAAIRAAKMVRQLMLFSGRDQQLEPREEDIAGIVSRTVAMCRTMFDKGIAVELGITPDLGSVRCEAVQIEQAILNVLLNARDALEGAESGERCIRVHLEKSWRGDGEPLASSERWVRIEISDNGAGMSPEVKRRALEPFFSTKGPGRGTGLGLSTTYAIVKKHGGRVEIESKEGAGTTVALVLPSLKEKQAHRDASGKLAPPPGQGESVLLVDDEPLVRDSVSRILAEAGYQVQTAVDGAEALELLQGAARFDVVLLDQSMPKMGGRAVLRELRSTQPDLPVICFSGYPSSMEDADAVLEKPVTGNELLETVAAVVRARKKPSGS